MQHILNAFRSHACSAPSSSSSNHFKMAYTWVLTLFAFLKSYPEILASVAIFLFLLHLPRRSGSRVPVNWPVVGMTPALVAHINHLHDFISDVLHEAGCTFMFRGPRFAGMDMLLTCDPANVNYIHNLNFANYPKGEEFSDMFEIFGDGIFNADGESWKFQRRIAQGFFADRSYRSFVAAATRDKAEKGLLPLLEHVTGSGGKVDLQDVFMRTSFDITCYVVFGVDPGCLSVSFPTIPFMKAIDDSWEALLKRHTMPKWLWKTLKWLKVGDEKKLAEAWVLIDEFIAQQIADRREESKNCRVNNDADTVRYNTNLLASYINNVVGQITGRYESDKFLRDTVLTLMIAGRDGFAICLTWLFYLISKNPDVEAKILKELRLNRAKKPDSKVFDMEDLSTMVYFHGAVCETLRLFPPVPLECKSALHADVLPSGHDVHPGTKVLFAVYAMGRMESLWGDDRMEFKPERWMAENGKPRYVAPYKFMAFNAGPRICPGREIALAQIKIIAAAVLWNFEVDVLEENEEVVPKNSVMIRMVNPLLIRVKKRNTYHVN